MKAFAVLATAAVVMTIVAWTTAIPAPTDADTRLVTVGSLAPAQFDTMALGHFATRLRTRDPFRLERRPTDVRYDPWPAQPPPAPPPAPPRPALALAGILGGPPWNALIEGIPGREGGVLLAVGDSAGGIRFMALRGDTVLLAGFDTTWTLTARQAWK